MNKENRHIENDIDRLLRERFAEHTISPEEELWDKIEQRMEPRVIPAYKYSRLKMVLFGSAAVIGGLVFLLFVLKNQKTGTDEYSENKPVANTISQEKTPCKNDIPIPPENSPALKNIPRNNGTTGAKKQAGQTLPSGIQELPVRENRKTEVENYPVPLRQIKALSTENIYLFDTAEAEKLKNIRPTYRKTDIKPNPPKHKNYHSNQHSIQKHISAKKYYARKPQNKGLIQLGKFFNNFDVKTNLSAAYSLRTVRNLQNSPQADYDPAFYNKTESGKISTGGGVELAYKINPSWSLYSGIKISEYAQQIRSTQNDYTVLSSSRVFFPVSAGNIGILGDGIGELPPQSRFETKLNLLYLDIPLVARRYFGPGFYADAGLKYSVLLADNTRVSLNDGSVNFSVEKITGLQKHNFGLVFGVGAEQVTRSGIRFEAGPEIILGLNNINPSARVRCVPASVGFRAAIFLGRYGRM